MASSQWERILIGSDLHSAFLDPKAWAAFLLVARYGNFDRIILNGDVADFSQISRHDKKLGGFQREFDEPVSLTEEILFIHREIWTPLRKAFPTKPITMRLGNHETRWLQFAESNPGALLEMLKVMKRFASVHLEDVLATDKFGIKISYNAIDRLYGTFTIIHGVKSSPGVSKANLLRYGSGTSGHSHRANAWTQVMQGKMQGWWESGCLRKTRDVEYLPMGDLPDWTNAFLTLTINKETGHFFCTPHFIIDGRCDFNGDIYPLADARQIRTNRKPAHKEKREADIQGWQPNDTREVSKAAKRRRGRHVGTAKPERKSVWSAIQATIARQVPVLSPGRKARRSIQSLRTATGRFAKSRNHR